LIDLTVTSVSISLRGFSVLSSLAHKLSDNLEAVAAAAAARGEASIPHACDGARQVFQYFWNVEDIVLIGVGMWQASSSLDQLFAQA
jgi:hypothetical protein